MVKAPDHKLQVGVKYGPQTLPGGYLAVDKNPREGVPLGGIVEKKGPDQSRIGNWEWKR